MPLINLIKETGLIKYKLVFSGQHSDLVKEEKADHIIQIHDNGSNRLDSIITSIMSQSSDIYNDITHVLVQGDTTTSLGFALSAYNRKIPIIHLEAGLRTYDLEQPYPEEGNRQLISRLTNIHLCPTENNKQNLLNEKCNGSIYVVGNTVLDNIKKYKHCITYENIVLVTLHRRENHRIIDKYFTEIEELARSNPGIKFILPIHPNPNVQKHKHILKHVNIMDPLTHSDLIDILIKCLFIITDSGGLQEEGSFLEKKIIICREMTERDEILGTYGTLCKDPSELSLIFYQLIQDPVPQKYENPYGNGESAQKIINILHGTGTGTA